MIVRIGSTAGAAGQMFGISRGRHREREILLQLINGLTKKEIGNMLSLSYHTIDTHVRKIYDKLHVDKRSSAVAKALKERIL